MSEFSLKENNKMFGEYTVVFIGGTFFCVAVILGRILYYIGRGLSDEEAVNNCIHQAPDNVKWERK